MNKQIIDALKNLGISVSFQTYAGKATTYITFFNYLENLENYADNEATSESCYIQVDVWSLGDYSILIKNVLESLKLAGFRRTYMTEMYENDTKLYHKIIRITKNKELI
ncbi:hypothetical protein [Clostridium tagluense]|uniref:hypothetical protein n=1 Tax=Clostridium tagluense TaxID=360422 RepID=UPI001CF3828A|nr:hypothetical protein [Clostridium tagluense]MCB2300654.1 hypothetical protein [Clostridium tagluense]